VPENRNIDLEALGVIGNCQYSALIHNSGEIMWCCLPRLDSDPVFSTLLDRENGGRFRIMAANGEIGRQRYLPHTNILETTFETSTGSFRIIDFAPRFIQYDAAALLPLSDPRIGSAIDAIYKNLASHGGCTGTA